MITDQLDLDSLEEWIRIPRTDLVERSPIPLEILPSVEAVHQHAARSLFDDLASSRANGSHVGVMVAMGPVGQYPLAAELVNEARLPLSHATFYGIDEWLDWQGRPLPWDHPCRLEAFFHRQFVERLDPALRPPPENVIFPSSLELDRPVEEMEKRGPVTTTYAGFGFHGHVGFNEPPNTRYSVVSLAQLRSSTTRIVALSADTLIAQSQRALGGNMYAIPPMGATLGLREVLAAKRVRFYSVTGPWKQTALRILLFSEATTEFPMTIISREHDDVRVCVDEATAASPPTEWT
jgi:glucosamine-6-phosphate deaminase